MSRINGVFINEIRRNASKSFAFGSICAIIKGAAMAPFTVQLLIYKN